MTVHIIQRLNFLRQGHFDMEQNFETLRKEFPVLQRKTYLNSGSYCALANEVRAADA